MDATARHGALAGRARAPAGAGAALPAAHERCTAASVWRIASARLPARLVAHGERRAVEAGLATVPPLSALIMERPLAVAAPQVDISLCATPADGGPRSWPDHPAWAALREFYCAWEQAEGLLRRAVPAIWLEFDRDQLVSALAVPCFFANTRQLAARDRQALVATIIRTFVEPALQAHAAERVEAILAGLPADGTLAFLGVMQSRRPVAVRLCIDLPSSLLGNWLAQAGHAGSPALRTITEMAAKHADAVVVHVDAVGAPGRIGVELKPRQRDGWPALLDDLAQRGLCSGDEREDLLAAAHRAGISRQVGKPGARSEFSVRAPAQWADVDTFVFECQLNHVKLVHSGNGELAAKAYLQMDYRWKDRKRAGQ